MLQLPDAPWIREAELFGPPEGDHVYCPYCNEEDPEYFVLDSSGEVIGCSCCTSQADPFEPEYIEKYGKDPYA